MERIISICKAMLVMASIALLLSFVIPSTVTAVENSVEVVLFNDSNENGQIEEVEHLHNPHKVQVSGSGNYTTGQTFHVPPDTQISYRLHSGGIYGGWQKQTFSAGYTDWVLLVLE